VYVHELGCVCGQGGAGTWRGTGSRGWKGRHVHKSVLPPPPPPPPHPTPSQNNISHTLRTVARWLTTHACAWCPLCVPVYVMDAKDMSTLRAGSFDVVIDKGAIPGVRLCGATHPRDLPATRLHHTPSHMESTCTHGVPVALQACWTPCTVALVEPTTLPACCRWGACRQQCPEPTSVAHRLLAIPPPSYPPPHPPARPPTHPPLPPSHPPTQEVSRVVCKDGLFVCFSGAPHDIRRQSLLHCGVGWAVDTLNCGEEVRVRRYVMRVTSRRGHGAPGPAQASESSEVAPETDTAVV
jgi:hypothetical protein